MFPPVTFVYGGASSGKSSWAEGFTAAAAMPMTYLATSQAQDREMQAKIEAHRARRGPDWTLVEEPMDLEPVLSGLAPRQICLIDCVTMWLSNQLLANADPDMAQASFCTAISNCDATLVIVSNEVGQGIVPDNALARQFREAQGRLNIALAAQSDLVVQVNVGLPLVLKGQMP